MNSKNSDLKKMDDKNIIKIRTITQIFRNRFKTFLGVNISGETSIMLLLTNHCNYILGENLNSYHFYLELIYINVLLIASAAN